MTAPWPVPSSWVWTAAGAVSKIVGGGTPRTSDASNFTSYGGVPWLTPADLSGYSEKYVSRGHRNITLKGLESSGARLLPAGALLFSSRAPIGYVAIASNPVATNQGFRSFVFLSALKPEFAYYYLRYAKPLAIALASGTTFLELSGGAAKRLPVVVAPLQEQRRIVEALESFMTRLDDAVATLERVQRNLKRYRASVLKAAVEGRLVPTEAELARAEGRDYEPASALLERILAERRRRWEEDQLAEMKVKSQVSNNQRWKANYREPTTPGTSRLPDLPEGWRWTTAHALCRSIGDVDHKMPPRAERGVPYVSTRDFISSNGIDFEGAKRITRADYDRLSKKIQPQYGDILLSRYGTVGEVRIIEARRAFQASYSIAILKPVDPPVARFLAYALRSEPLQTQMRLHIRASAQPDLGLAHIRELLIPLPPRVEQQRIVASIELNVSMLDHVETYLENEIARVGRLRQSILKWAFEGKLVEQDPNDEPASVLLERIRAARTDATEAKPRRAKRARRQA